MRLVFFQGRQSCIEYVLSYISGAADLWVRCYNKRGSGFIKYVLRKMFVVLLFWYQHQREKGAEQSKMSTLGAQQSPVIPKAFLAQVVSD